MDDYYGIYVDAGDANFDYDNAHIDKLPRSEEFITSILDAGTEHLAWGRAMQLRVLRPNRIG